MEGWSGGLQGENFYCQWMQHVFAKREGRALVNVKDLIGEKSSVKQNKVVVFRTRFLGKSSLQICSLVSTAVSRCVYMCV